MITREKIIREFKYETETGYFFKDDFILHSFDDEKITPQAENWLRLVDEKIIPHIMVIR